MISIVLYGRNDNYGYNLHKRAALSLNCMAEVLTSPSDEILFVDYNTPDDFPTFPEAIQDTLTGRAIEMLRIFRVRPRVHERFKSKTHLLALEPIARNVAIRRSSEGNRWILSTNTDIVFVPLHERSLSGIVRGLLPGFYHAPRIEIPEVLWESLDRKDPAGVIKTVREWGSTLHLNEIVLGSNLILYDGPGDFQLLLRTDLFEYQGFDESMLLGWHVDSNMAARMQLKYGQVGDLGQQVYGYHCDHTRQVTPAHSHSRVQNDWRRFVTEVTHSEIIEQADTWGCADDPIEEIRLASRSAKIYVQALRGAIGRPLAAAKIVEYTGQTYNKVDYDPQHVLPFLADMFASMPRSFNVAWYGAREETLILFARIWESLGFSGKIIVDEALPLADVQASTVAKTSSAQALVDADAFIFDFGGVASTSAVGLPIGDLRRMFRRVVSSERHRLLHGAALRRIIALNAINNEHEWFVCGLVAAAATPFSTHMRHGFVLPPSKAAESWLAGLGIGEAGVRVGDEIRNVPTKRGWIAYGPYKYLDEGTYDVSLKIELLDADSQNLPKSEPCLFVEVRSGSNLLALHLFCYEQLLVADQTFEFSVAREIADGIDGVETRIAVMAPVAVVIRKLTVQWMSASIGPDHKVPAALRLKDWLPFFRLGERGKATEGGVVAQTGPGDFVIYGPYWTLPNGRYELTVQIESERARPITRHVVISEVLADERQLVAATFDLMALHCVDEHAVGALRLPFELSEASSDKRQVEFRIWSSGEERFTIRSVVVRAAEHVQQTNLMPFLLIGRAGQHASGEIRSEGERIGLIAYSPILWLEPRVYRLNLSVVVCASHDTGEHPGALLIVKCGSNILEVLTIKAAGSIAEESELTFEVPSHSGFQVLLQALAAADIRLRALTIEPALAGAVRPAEAAILRIETWLPFLQTAPFAHAEQDGIVVDGGEPGYAIFGPFLTLPPGDYELVASVVPLAPDAEGEPIITVDITTEAGQRRFAEHQWHVGHFQIDEGARIAELRLPFTLAPDLSPALRTIETRIFTSGERSVRVRSLAVKPRSFKKERDWFAYLAVGECGINTGHEIKSITGKRGYIASLPVVQVEPGRYKLSADVVAIGDQAYVGLEIWSGAELIAIGIAGTDRPLEFDVPEAATQRGVKLFLHAVTAAVVSIRSLVVERTSKSAAPSLMPAILRLDDWLPFLQSKPIAHAEEDGIMVTEGAPGYAIYGPYWTLPPGDYEMVALVVPLAPNADGKPVITLDVTTEAGQRQFASHRWHVGHFQIDEAVHTPELRLPFTLAADLSPALRTIETRIFTSGESSFRIRSLAVKPRNPKKERDWFATLAIGECGIHTGREIKSIAGSRGYIASLPVVQVEPCRYKLIADVVAIGDQAYVGLEIWSGAELIAIGMAGTNRPLEFDVTEAAAHSGVKLFLHAVTAAVVSIRGLVVERTSKSAAPSLVPAILRLDDWLPFLQTKPIAHAEEDGIMVNEGAPEFAIYGPFWTLPPGDYELIASVVSLASDTDGKPVITVDVTTERGQRLFASHQWKGIQIDEAAHIAELRLPFSLAADLSPALRTIETRIFTSGESSFRIRSLTIKYISDPLMRTGKKNSIISELDAYSVLRHFLYRAKLRLIKRLRAALATIKSVLRN